MHKIKKYQYPASGIQSNYWKPTWQQTMQGVNGLTANRTRYQNMGMNFSEAAKMAASVSSGNSLLGGSATGAISGAAGISPAGAGGMELLGKAPELIDAGFQLFGGRKANMTGQQSAGMGLLGNISGSLLKSGDPALMAIGGLGLAGKAVMEYAGPTSQKQATGNLNMTGYDTSVSTGADQKKLAWFGAKKKVKKIDTQTAKADYSNLLKFQASNQATQNQQAATQTTQSTINKNYQQLTGFSKKGGTINPAVLRTITSKVKKSEPIFIEEPEIEKFENGGTLKNVIPDGALHARKHNLGGDIAEFITDKGIPVITIAEAGEEIVNDDGKKILAEGGEITQHAEIERDEIIFSKPTTDQLEEYFKQYSESDSDEEKNRIMLECGRFLASEILENTIDNTGIINETIVK